MKSQQRNFAVRPAQPKDSGSISRMCSALWPDGTASEHEREVRSKIAGRFPSALPVAIFVAESTLPQSAKNRTKDRLIGFIEVGLRSHADGCDESHPVGFLEGWYVVKDRRRSGIGAALVASAEKWARRMGCSEMASDALIDNKISQTAHQALGYEIVDRCVHFLKSL